MTNIEQTHRKYFTNEYYQHIKEIEKITNKINRNFFKANRRLRYIKRNIMDQTFTPTNTQKIKFHNMEIFFLIKP